MGLSPQFSRTDIQAHIEQRLQAYRKAMLNRLKQAGEKFVNIARTSGNYIDQTGNLRSSIGYIILYNGAPLFESFPGEKQEAKNAGKVLAQREATNNGYCLVAVAGMDYAAAVESNGKDVISGTSLIIESWLKNALTHLKSKL